MSAYDELVATEWFTEADFAELSGEELERLSNAVLKKFRQMEKAKTSHFLNGRTPQEWEHLYSELVRVTRFTAGHIANGEVARVCIASEFEGNWYKSQASVKPKRIPTFDEGIDRLCKSLERVLSNDQLADKLNYVVEFLPEMDRYQLEKVQSLDRVLLRLERRAVRWRKQLLTEVDVRLLRHDDLVPEEDDWLPEEDDE